MFYELHQKVEYAFGKVFEKYGRFIARHPVKVICIVVIINIALAVGLVTLKTESGIEQYVPTGSAAIQNRDQVTFNVVVVRQRHLIHTHTQERFFPYQNISMPLKYNIDVTWHIME